MKREQAIVLLISSMAFLFGGTLKNVHPARPRVKYVALGDSLAVGLITLGGGYVNEYGKWLVQNCCPQGIELTNLGTSGWKSRDVLKAILEDHFYRETVRTADILTLDVGGNDLLGCNFELESLRFAVREYHTNLMAILSEIRQLNPKVPLYLMDLYNPYPAGHPRRSLADNWIPLFNREVRIAAATPNFQVTGVTDVFSAFQGHEKEYTWINEFGDIHPNNQGHSVICQCFAAVTKQEGFAPEGKL